MPATSERKYQRSRCSPVPEKSVPVPQKSVPEKRSSRAAAMFG
jgi:hypothetical protein